MLPNGPNIRNLRWLNRYDTVIPILLALALYIFGALLERFAPQLGTNGMQLVVWGFFISTVVLAACHGDDQLI